MAMDMVVDVLVLLGLQLTALLLALLLWGLLEPLRLVQHEERAEIPRLPPEWRGHRIGLLSDLHVGMFLNNTPTVRRAVRRLVAARPAVVLLAGDFVHDSAAAAPRAAALLRPLVEAGIPTYAVLGNHDHAMPTRDHDCDPAVAQAVRDALAAAGVRVLRNERVALPLPRRDPDARSGPGACLHLVGIGAHTPRDDHSEPVLAELPPDAPRIVLMHHPASFEKLPAHAAPFALAGHTHGGQVRLPFAPVWRYLTYVKEAHVYIAGWVESQRIDGYGEAGNSLYVSRGIGCALVPLRINCPPEFTLFTLTEGEPEVSSNGGTVRTSGGEPEAAS